MASFFITDRSPLDNPENKITIQQYKQRVDRHLNMVRRKINYGPGIESQSLKFQQSILEELKGDIESGYQRYRYEVRRETLRTSRFAGILSTDQINQIRHALAEADFMTAGEILATVHDSDGVPDGIIAEIQFQKGMLFLFDFDYENAYRFIRQAAQKSGSNQLFIHKAAWLSYTLEQYQDAKYFYKETIRLATLNPKQDNTDLGAISNILGWIYNQEQDYANAVIYYKKALAYEEQKPVIDLKTIKELSGRLGRLHTELQKHEESENYYRKELMASNRLYGSNTMELIDTLTQIGLNLESGTRYFEAIKYYNDALTICNNNNFRNDICPDAIVSQIEIARRKLISERGGNL